MLDLRFDDRVAIIPGAGRELDRSYALLLAPLALYPASMAGDFEGRYEARLFMGACPPHFGPA
jgi:hypothetical protein